MSLCIWYDAFTVPSAGELSLAANLAHTENILWLLEITQISKLFQQWGMWSWKKKIATVLCSECHISMAAAPAVGHDDSCSAPHERRTRRHEKEEGKHHQMFWNLLTRTSANIFALQTRTHREAFFSFPLQLCWEATAIKLSTLLGGVNWS